MLLLYIEIERKEKIIQNILHELNEERGIRKSL